MQAEKLLDRGIHPVRIGEGFDRACQVAVKHLEMIADAVEFSMSNKEVCLEFVRASHAVHASSLENT